MTDETKKDKKEPKKLPQRQILVDEYWLRKYGTVLNPSGVYYIARQG